MSIRLLRRIEISRFLRSAEVRLRLWSLLEAGLWIVALGCLVLLLGIGARALRDLWAFTPPVYAGLAAALAVWALVLLASRGFLKNPPGPGGLPRRAAPPRTQ